MDVFSVLLLLSFQGDRGLTGPPGPPGTCDDYFRGIKGHTVGVPGQPGAKGEKVCD